MIYCKNVVDIIPLKKIFVANGDCNVKRGGPIKNDTELKKHNQLNSTNPSFKPQTDPTSSMTQTSPST